MPVSKAFIKVNGEKIIERNLRIMRRLFSEVLIVTNQPEEYVYLSAQMLGDVYDVRGPMTGIFTALLNSSNEWVFVSACDIPFINEEIISYASSMREGYDAVVPGSGKAAEPLFAFYSKRLVSSMEQGILSGKRGMKDFLDKKKVKYIKKTEIKGFDPEAKSFINLNTPEDIERYLQPQERLESIN
ncbi:MAG: molybdenum cofactor guanylyltransferase [Nitrospirae bacterium]|nr:molybdenum cofactor guanylyltransferase [Nitrospirota bacterium]